MFTNEMRREYQKEYQQRIKGETINEYGGRCEVCGFRVPICLEFHHKSGGGNIQRMAANGIERSWKRRYEFYRETRNTGEIVLLCRNCHALAEFDETYLAHMDINKFDYLLK